jgi:hypothetical protein
MAYLLERVKEIFLLLFQYWTEAYRQGRRKDFLEL